jgi:hypothetical protein
MKVVINSETTIAANRNQAQLEELKVENYEFMHPLGMCSGFLIPPPRAPDMLTKYPSIC